MAIGWLWYHFLLRLDGKCFPVCFQVRDGTPRLTTTAVTVLLFFLEGSELELFFHFSALFYSDLLLNGV